MGIFEHSYHLQLRGEARPARPARRLCCLPRLVFVPLPLCLLTCCPRAPSAAARTWRLCPAVCVGGAALSALQRHAWAQFHRWPHVPCVAPLLPRPSWPSNAAPAPPSTPSPPCKYPHTHTTHSHPPGRSTCPPTRRACCARRGACWPPAARCSSATSTATAACRRRRVPPGRLPRETSRPALLTLGSVVPPSQRLGSAHAAAACRGWAAWPRRNAGS